jgi:hypothetical protein
MRVRLFPVASTLCVAVVAAVAAPVALGAPGNGAEHVHLAGCVESFPPPTTTCYTTDLVQNRTVAPSGVESFVVTGTQSFSYTQTNPPFPAYSQSATSRVQAHFLYKDGQLSQQGEGSRGEMTFGDDTFRVHCTYRMRTQYANGSLVFSMEESACELVP